MCRGGKKPKGIGRRLTPMNADKNCALFIGVYPRSLFAGFLAAAGKAGKVSVYGIRFFGMAVYRGLAEAPGPLKTETAIRVMTAA
jgi:hypothetical protein